MAETKTLRSEDIAVTTQGVLTSNAGFTVCNTDPTDPCVVICNPDPSDPCI